MRTNLQWQHVALLPLAEVSQLEQTKHIQFITLILSCLKRMCSKKLHICAARNFIFVQQETSCVQQRTSYLCSKKLNIIDLLNLTEQHVNLNKTDLQLLQITMANLSVSLQKLDSYMIKLYQGIRPNPGCLCSFDRSPTSYKEQKLDKCQSRKYMAIVGFLYHFFLPCLHKAKPLIITCWRVHWRSPCDQMKWERIKKISFSLCRCWRTAVFIISTQPFLTVASSVLMSNLAYPDGTRIRNIIFEKRNSLQDIKLQLINCLQIR
jgi:hypothetical protein